MKIPLKLFLGLALMIPACNRNEPTRVGAAPEDRSNDQKTNDQNMKRQRDDYVKTTQAKLDEYDKKIDGLEARTSAMSGPAKDQANRPIQQLKDQRKDVESKLSDLKSVNPESWNGMKAEVDSSMAMLERSYQDVSKRLEASPAGTSNKSY